MRVSHLSKKALLKTNINPHASLTTLWCGIGRVQWDEVGREVGKMRRKRALNRRPQRATGLFWVVEETRWEWARVARGRQEAQKTDSAWGHLVDPISGIQGLLSFTSVYLYDSPLSLSAKYAVSLLHLASQIGPKPRDFPKLCLIYPPWQAARRVLPGWHVAGQVYPLWCMLFFDT